MKITKKIAKEMLNSGNEFLVQTALQAYPLLGIDKVSKRALAFIQLEKKIAEANEGWTPNFDDNEEKYYPWFDLRDGKITLVSVYLCGNSGVPPSLIFKSEDLARRFYKENKQLYNDLYGKE